MAERNLLAQAQADKDLIVNDRRNLHRHPGTGFDIPYSVEYVTKALTEMGYDPQPCGKAGVVALAGGKKPGKVFMIRADMDALPICEESGEEFSSEVPGKMHACGHDNHTAMLLEAARLLKKHEEEICGTIKLDFQPAEEIFLGADDMIQAGVLENPHVDAAMMIHVAAGIPLPAGMVLGNSAGVSMAACDFFDVTVKGKGAHGSAPSAGIDPIVSACTMVQAIQEIQTRELYINDEVVLTVGYFNAGATNNVIPDSAKFGGSLRTFDEEARAQVKERVAEVCEAIGKAFRTEVEVVWGHGCPTLINDAELAECIPGYLKEMLGPYGCMTVADMAKMAPSGGRTGKAAGSEDFAFITQKVPSYAIFVGAGNPKEGYLYSQHHPKVRFDERCLPVGAAAYAQAALRWLEEHPAQE